MSDLDEDFGNFLAFLAEQGSDEGKRLWDDRVKGIRNNKRKLHEILSNIEHRWILPESGNITKVPTFSVHPHRFARIYEKCFRALYYKTYGSVYPIDHQFQYYYPRDLTGENEELLSYMSIRNVGSNHVFYSGVARAEDVENAFVGLLLFYERLAVVGFSADPDDLRNRAAKSEGSGS